MHGLLRASLREHWKRYVATAVAIMLATGFMLTCLVITGGFYKSVERSLAGNTLGADIVMYPDELKGGSDSDLENMASKVESKIETEAIREVREGFATVKIGSEQTYVTVYSIPDKPFTPPMLGNGNYPQNSGELALDGNSAASLGVELGDQITLQIDKPTPVTENSETGETLYQDFQTVSKTMRVSGVTVGGPVHVLSQILVTSETFSDLFSDDISTNFPMVIYTAKDGKVNQLQEQISALIQQEKSPVLVSSQTKYVSMNVDRFTDGSGVLVALLLIFPMISTVTAIIVVSVTFQVLLAQRKRELALLRAIGATRKQIRVLVVREALAVGAVASLLGVGLGLLGGIIANQYSTLTVTVGEALSAVSPWYLLVTLLVGIATTLLGSLAPSRSIAKVTPMEALHPEDSVYVKRRRTILKTVLGAIGLAIGVVCTVVGLRIVPDVEAVDSSAMLYRFLAIFFGSLLSFIGVLILMQILTPYLTLGLGKIFGKYSVISDISAENTVRNPGRTGATVTALTLGITLVSTMLVGSVSLTATVDQELNKKVPVDFSVYSSEPITEAQRSQISDLPAVKSVIVGDTLTARVQDLENHGIGDDSENQDVLDDTLSALHTAKFTADNTRGDLGVPGEDEVWVSSWMWNPTWDKDPAARVEIRVGNVELKLRPILAYLEGYTVSESNFATLVQGLESVGEMNPSADKAGDTTSYALSGSEIKDEDTALPQLTPNGIAYVLMDSSAKPVDITMLGNTVSANIAHAQLSGDGSNRIVALQMLEALTYGIVAMLAVSVLVALVGVANTLALSVVERRRENAVLRAVGLTKRGMRGMLAAEALLIGAVGAAAGCALGILYGWLGLQSLPIDAASSSGVSVVFIVPWLSLAVTLIVAVFAALLASWIPGRSATKVAPVAALSEAD